MQQKINDEAATIEEFAELLARGPAREERFNEALERNEDFAEVLERAHNEALIEKINKVLLDALSDPLNDALAQIWDDEFHWELGAAVAEALIRRLAGDLAEANEELAKANGDVAKAIKEARSAQRYAEDLAEIRREQLQLRRNATRSMGSALCPRFIKGLAEAQADHRGLGPSPSRIQPVKAAGGTLRAPSAALMSRGLRPGSLGDARLSGAPQCISGPARARTRERRTNFTRHRSPQTG